MTKPFNYWTSATRKFDSHEFKSETHKTSVVTMQSFLSVMNNEIIPINQMQNELINSKVSKNREIL